MLWVIIHNFNCTQFHNNQNCIFSISFIRYLMPTRAAAVGTARLPPSLSACLSPCLLSSCPLSLSPFPSVLLSLYVSTSLSVSLFPCLSVSVPPVPLFLFLSPCPSVSAFPCPSVSLSVSQSVFLCLILFCLSLWYLSLPVCLYLSPSLDQFNIIHLDNVCRNNSYCPYILICL